MSGSPPSLRSFLWIWLGQVVSVFGSGLTGFALGVWVYQSTGSATQFTLIAVSATLPGALLSPLAGVLADRWDRRLVMILGDAGAAVSTVVLLGLLAFDRLQLWHVYPIVAWGAAFTSLQVPAYMASVTMLIPKEHFSRAHGALELGESVARIFAPLLAGVLLSAVGIEWVIALDLGTFLFAMLTLLMVRVPRPEISAAGRAARGSMLHQVLFGWRYIVSRPGLAGLLAFFWLVNFLIAISIVLVTPLVLSFASASELGAVLAAGSAGSLLGGVVMSSWGGPRRRVLAILALSPLLALGMATMGLRPWVPLIALGNFAFFLLVPVLNASHLAIWQVKVEPDVQGRVFAVRRLIFQLSFPLAFLLAGPLADAVFGPLLAVGGPLAGSVGRLLGVGPGRGIAFLFVTLGALLAITAGLGSLSSRLRSLEREVPDAIPDRVPVGA